MGSSGLGLRRLLVRRGHAVLVAQGVPRVLDWVGLAVFVLVLGGRDGNFQILIIVVLAPILHILRENIIGPPIARLGSLGGLVAVHGSLHGAASLCALLLTSLLGAAVLLHADRTLTLVSGAHRPAELLLRWWWRDGQIYHDFQRAHFWLQLCHSALVEWCGASSATLLAHRLVLCVKLGVVYTV